MGSCYNSSRARTVFGKQFQNRWYNQFLERYSCDNRRIKSDNFRTQKEFVYSRIVQFNQQVTANQLSFSGLTPCGVFLSFYKLCVYIQEYKKNFSREATREKERNGSRKSTIMPSFISLAISRGKQGGFFLLSSGKRFFSDHKSGTSSATFSVVV